MDLVLEVVAAVEARMRGDDSRSILVGGIPKQREGGGAARFGPGLLVAFVDAQTRPARPHDGGRRSTTKRGGETDDALTAANAAVEAALKAGGMKGQTLTPFR